MNNDDISKQNKDPQISDRDMVAAAVRLAGRREVPPDSDRDRIFNAAAETLQRKLTARRRRRWVGTAIAASLVMAVAVGLNLQRSPPAPTEQRALADRVIGVVTQKVSESDAWEPLSEGDALAANSLLRTGDAGQAGILMSNGTSVRLSADTTIELLAANTLRLEDGKVYVDAGEDPRTSIEIISAVGITRDIGTQFEVRYVANDYRLRIREGEVSLATEDRQLLAEAGEELTVDSTGSARVRQFSNHEQDWSWAEELAPVPNLDGQPLATLLDWVSRETGRSVSYATAEIEAQAAVTLLHGSVRKMSPLDTLGAMLSTTDLRYLLQEDGTILIYPEG